MLSSQACKSETIKASHTQLVLVMLWVCRAGQSIVQMARQGEHGYEYAIKLFVRREAFEEERGIYCNRHEGLGRHASSLMLPQVLSFYQTCSFNLCSVV